MNDRIFGHAAAGYKNAQEIIRFVDQKNAFVSSLSTAIAGIALTTLTKAFATKDGLPSALVTPTTGHKLALSLFVLSFLVALYCIYCLLRSTVARGPRIDSTVQYPALFPFVASPGPKTKDSCAIRHIWRVLFSSGAPPPTQAALEEYREKLCGKLSAEVIAHEYADQLVAVGCILATKISFHRRAVFAVAFQAGLLLLGALVAIVATDWSKLHPG